MKGCKRNCNTFNGVPRRTCPLRICGSAWTLSSKSKTSGQQTIDSASWLPRERVCIHSFNITPISKYVSRSVYVCVCSTRERRNGRKFDELSPAFITRKDATKWIYCKLLTLANIATQRSRVNVQVPSPLNASTISAHTAIINARKRSQECMLPRRFLE